MKRRSPVMTLAVVMTLVMTIIACRLPALETVVMTPTPEPSPVMTPTVMTLTPTVMTTPAGPALLTFTVTAWMLNIRDQDHNATGEYLTRGKTVQCVMTEAGWCEREDGSQVWAGCLEPNPQQRGCKER